jgi:hypothetical protein
MPRASVSGRAMESNRNSDRWVSGIAFAVVLKVYSSNGRIAGS